MIITTVARTTITMVSIITVTITDLLRISFVPLAITMAITTATTDR